ncbi:tetratricopeptide repeat protein [Thalassotalea agarivorans]|uniref:hypothetical protein n=1 Tax=Thalassotalea agarivorans TaxID=349064 RepID=UPI002572BC01|nr:hypothetical protein [Thalassotalea agarivorans]
MAILSSSSFHLMHYLNKALSEETPTPEIITLGTKHNIAQALRHARMQTSPRSPTYHQLSAALAKQDVEEALLLAHRYAENRHDKDAQLWFEQAMRLAPQKAQIPYATWLYERGQYSDINAMLDATNTAHLPLLMRVNIRLGNVYFVEQHIEQLEDANIADELVEQINRYQVVTSLPKFVSQCENSVQPIATSLEDLTSLESKLATLRDSFVASQFCFDTPKYVPIDRLQCNRLPNAPIMCDEDIWLSYQGDIAAKLLLVMLPRGGANVHGGIMYIDRADTPNVIEHELMHWLGFVDEYPLRATHNFCTGAYVAKNVVVLDADASQSSRETLLAQLPWRIYIEEDTVLVSEQDGELVLGTPKNGQQKIGLYRAKTCDNSATQAYRPLPGRNIMTHLGEGLPPLYQRMISEEQSIKVNANFRDNGRSVKLFESVLNKQ